MPIAIDGSNEVATVAKVTITTEKLVPVFFLAKQHQEDKVRIVWHDETENKAFSQLLRAWLKEKNAMQKDGTAPRNPAERRLRAWLEKANVRNGGA